MNTTVRKGIMMVFLGVLILTLFHCQRNEKPLEKRIISVSILPQKYIIDRITDNRFDVNVLIPPGASPVSYEPSPKQIRELSKSDLYFQIGYIIFEKSWIKNISEQIPELKITDLSENIEMINSGSPHHHEPWHNSVSHHFEKNHDNNNITADPHIWMSPKNMKIICTKVYKTLIELYPADSLDFRTNYLELIKDIDEIDSLFLSSREKILHLKFYIYHPALAYLAKDYDMVQQVLEQDGKEPGPAYMARLIEDAKENNIRYIFIQKQFNQENARTFANATGAKIIQIDPLAENWYDQMKYIYSMLTTN